MLKALIVFLFTGWRDVKYFGIPSYVVEAKLKYPTCTETKFGIYFPLFDRFEYIDDQEALHFSKRLHPEVEMESNETVLKTVGTVDQFEVVSWKKVC